MHSFSFGEIALIFGIVVILFGGSRLASIGKSLGEGIANFKKGLNGGEDVKSQNQTSQSQHPRTQDSISYTPPQVSTTHVDTQKSVKNEHVIDVEQK